MATPARRIVILGGGTGGTITANRLRKRYDMDQAHITVVDQDDRHVYQPGLLFVPFGLTHPEDIVRPRSRQLRAGIDYHQSPIDRVDVDGNMVHLSRRQRRWATTCWSSPPGRACSRRRPRASPARGGWRRSSPSTTWRAPRRWRRR